eukprot:111226_1
MAEQKAVEQKAAEQKENEQKQNKQKVVICGGGNAAHVFFGLSVSDPNNDVYLLSLFKTEAADFKSKIVENKNKLTLEIVETNSNKEVTVNPSNISNDPTIFKDADIIIISLPAFAHNQYLKEIAKNLGDRNCLIGIFPGASGLECEWQSIINNKESCKYGSKYTLLSCITLPWACRIKSFGQTVEILGTKSSVRVSIYPKYDKIYIDKFSKIIGKLPELVDYGHIINMSLGATNAIIHPSILYDKWINWDGKPLDNKPLFYQGI